MIRSQILVRKLIPSLRFAFTLPGSMLACAAPFLACLGAAPAQAAPLVTFVSGKGTNAGNCADPAHPCRSFQFAIDQTDAGGEVNALDPAHYGRVTISKSISIIGVEGAGRILNNVTDAITINAGPNDVVNLSHLTLDGVKTAQNGIVLNSGGSLTITHCVVRNFGNDGILLQPTGATKFLIGDTLVSDNSNFGIIVFPRGTGSAQGTLDHVLANKNDGGAGILVSAFSTTGVADVTDVDSMATNNPGDGFRAEFSGILRLAHSAATGNGTGVRVGASGIVESFGDNDIHGNVTDVAGSLTTVLKR